MSKISGHDEFPTHAVPLAERVTAFRVAAVASMVSFSLATFIAGIEVSAGVKPNGLKEMLRVCDYRTLKFTSFGYASAGAMGGSSDSRIYATCIYSGGTLQVREELEGQERKEFIKEWRKKEKEKKRNV